MKKKLQKLLAIVCVAVSVLGLIGCAKPFDAAAYVQAELDLLTKHDVAQYQKTLGVGESEAEEIYQESISGVSSAIDEMIASGMPEDLRAGYEEWFMDLLSKSKYTVLEATKTDDGYTVQVEIEPIKAFDNASAALEEQLTVYLENLMTEAMTTGVTPTEEEINADVFQMLLDIVTANLENPTYAEKVVTEIHIEKNSDGQYEVNEDDAESLGASLIDITGLEDLQ